MYYTKTMSVRSATSTDTSAISRLLSEFREVHVDESLVSDIFAAKFKDNPDRAVLLAETDDKSVRGLCIVSIVYKLGETECRIDNVVVSESARGHGLGSQLLTAAKEWAWNNGADSIGFTSRPSREAANRLYQKAGFPLHTTNAYKLKRED